MEQKRRECNALIEKKKIEELYLNQLKAVEKSLSNKIESYQKEIELSQLYNKELEAVST